MIRLAVRCRPELADRVLAELLELSPNGVEEEHGPGYVELAIYGPPGEVPELPELRAAAGEGLVGIATAEVPDDWGDRWRDFHRPVEVGGGLRVVPSWEAGDEARPLDVVVDPGRAFGTGGHATTLLCLRMLADLAAAGEAGGSLADWGTGSGVLAIAAAKLGWGPVRACDHEAAALEAAAANAELNGVEVGLEGLDLRREPPLVAPTVTANLTGPLLLAVAEHLVRHQPGGGGHAVPERLDRGQGEDRKSVV